MNATKATIENAKLASDLQREFGGKSSTRKRLKSYVPQPREESPVTESCQRQSEAWVYLKHVGDRNGKSQYAGVMRINNGQEFQVISDFHGYLPEQNGWYICSVPRLDQPFLFVDERSRAMVFTVEVFPTEMTRQKTNGTEIVVVKTTISMSCDLLEKLEERNRIVIFFDEKKGCFQIFSEENRRTILKNLSGREIAKMGTRNPWKSQRNGILISPIYSALEIEEILDAVVNGNSDCVLSDALNALNSGATKKVLITV